MLSKAYLKKKIYVHFLLLMAAILVIVGGISYLLGKAVFSWVEVMILMVFCLFLAVLVYYVDMVVPLRAVLDQVKAILTGRKYKKIYTERTDEIGIFAHFFNEITASLEKVTDELSESRRVSGELKTAGQLQKELIPVQAPTINGFDIAIKNRSAEELGGDNLDFIQVGKSTYFYVGDVTGHGVPAAIVMTMVNTLINAYAEIYATAREIVVNTNRRLKKRIRATMFMTMLMLKWDAEIRKMTYVGCGHEHLVLYRAGSGEVTAIASGGIALGMVADNSKIVKEQEVEMAVGDVMVLYTDGITEARNMKGEMFGLERLKQLVSLYGSQGGAQDISRNIARDFSRFVEEHVQEDDVTLVVIKRLEDGVESQAVIDHKQERWSAESAKIN